MSGLGPELEAILAKDDTEVWLDELRELFGADLDVDSRFTIAQVITAMEQQFRRGAEWNEMIHRAKAEAARRLLAKDVGGCPECVNPVCTATHVCQRQASAIEAEGQDTEEWPDAEHESAVPEGETPQ